MARIVHACRGDGVAYVEVMGIHPHDFIGVRTAEGIALPASVVPLGKDACAIVLPLADTSRYELVAKDGSWCLSIGSFELKLRSKLAYIFQRAAVTRLKNAEFGEGAECLSVRFVQVVEDGNECVVRACVDAPRCASRGASFDITILDASGAPIDQHFIFIMEDCKDAVDERGRAVRRVTLAIRLSLTDHCIGLAVAIEDDSCQPGGCMLLDDMYIALRDGFNNLTMDAKHDSLYHQWQERHRPSDEELRLQSVCVFGKPPVFSIVVPLFHTRLDYFDAMYASLRNQSYGNWELVLVSDSSGDRALSRRLSRLSDERVIVFETLGGGVAENTNVGIDAARGNFICFLDYDDELAPNALYEYACVTESYPDVDLLYCDEDRFDARGIHSAPFFKPDYSPELLRAHNYINHFLCVSRKCIDQIGLMNDEFNGAQGYDFTLRAAECARKIFHVPRILYHWRLHEASTGVNPESKVYAKDAGRRAVQAHCDRLGFKASVVRTDMPFAYRVVRSPRDWGRVDIIIPSKDHSDLLQACVESILELCSYQNYRIIIVENNSVKPETFAFYEDIQARDSRVSIVTWWGEFNYSKIVNFGAAYGDSPYILFLNNDTKVISSEFLEDMLGYFEDEGVGVVGAKLLFADGTVQHAGVGVGLLGAAAHLFTSLPADAGGYFDRAQLPQNLSAVTGACQLVRRMVYEQVGGYTEEFTVGYNDVDFCLKVGRAGYRTVYTPYARLIHFEFSSRGRDMRGQRMVRVEQETALLHARWPELFEHGDPYLNPNLSRSNCYFALGED